MNRFQEIKNGTEAFMVELLEHRLERIRKGYSSNVFVLAWYDEALYVDPAAPSIDYAPLFLYDGIREDEERLKAFLQKKFVQLMEYETEEIRREYRIRLGLAAKEFFALLLANQEGGKINVWFGEYMKHAEIIGRI